MRGPVSDPAESPPGPSSRRRGPALLRRNYGSTCVLLVIGEDHCGGARARTGVLSLRAGPKTREIPQPMLSLLVLLIGGPPPDSIYWQQRVAYEITASLDEPSG